MFSEQFTTLTNSRKQERRSYPNPSTYRLSFANLGTLLCASFMPRAFIQFANAPLGKAVITKGRNTFPVIRSL